MSKETFNLFKRALELCQKRPVSMSKEADAAQIGAAGFLRVYTRARQITNYTLQHTATHCVAVCCSALQCVAVADLLCHILCVYTYAHQVTNDTLQHTATHCNTLRCSVL